MDKSAIIDSIRQIAAENGGAAPGRAVFERYTGIRMTEWYPHLWLRWGDALIEAGFSPNKFQTAISEDDIVKHYITLARELNHLPVIGEWRRKARTDKGFPSHAVLARFGGNAKVLEAVQLFATTHSGHDDIINMLANRPSARKTDNQKKSPRPVTGFVYLMKSGRHYKIGRTVSVGSRERQLTIKIPISPRTIHSIETDDPVGVEAYWHRRFESKRGEGEWFDLTSEDIAAFKRWKRIV